MAIIVASAVASPNLEMRVLFLGNVKLKYIALVAVLTSFFGITSNNAGGEIAHLGGALTGYLFVVSLRKGKDITKWLNVLLDNVVNLFSRKKLKVKKTKYSAPYRKMTDEEFNMEKVRRMQEIDRILDKIKSSGYDSLTSEERNAFLNRKTQLNSLFYIREPFLFHKPTTETKIKNDSKKKITKWGLVAARCYCSIDIAL